MPPVGKLPPSDEADETIYRMLDGDDTRVVLYRYRRLAELGVDSLTALALAEIRDSPHKMELLLARGCDVGTAASIVL